jgi:hypothetical protein
MKKTRVLSILFVVVLLAVAVITDAQQVTKVRAVGYVATTVPDTPNNLAFRR